MKTYKKIMTLLSAGVCSLGLASTGIAEEAESVKLTLQFDPGKVYHTTQSTNMLMNMGAGMQMINDMNIQMKSTAKEHKKGVSVAVTYDRMTMLSKMGDNIVSEYDSDKKDNDPKMQEILEPLLKMEFSAIYDKQGKYLGCEGLDNMPVPAGSGFSKASIEAMMEQASLMLPQREVKVGESWLSNMSIPMEGVGEMEMSFDQKLVSVKKTDGKNIAKVEFTGKVKPLVIKQHGVEVKMSSKAINGSILFDTDLNQATKTEMNMELNMDAGGQKMAMSMLIVQEITKVEDAK